MIGPDRIRALIPHAGAMCLLEQVLQWDESTIRCLASSHRDAQHPLRRDGALSALHLIEYCAQALALHRGLVAEAKGEAAPRGWLVSTRDFKLAVTRLDELPAPIAVNARELLYYEGGTQYEVSAEADGQLLGSGRISVVKAPE